jgi:glycogen(starch) synthase
MRRILMSGDSVGGVWTYALELSRCLGARGCQVLLATMGAPLTEGQRREAAAVGNLEVAESEYKLEWMEEPWADVERAGEWLMALAARFEPEVVHLNGYAHASLPWTVPALVVAHSCVLSWWRAVRGEAAPASRYREEMRRGLEAAAMVIAPTRAMLAALARESGAALRQTRVIANGRAAARLQPRGKRKLVLAAGRVWDEAKNLGSLARVAPRLGWPVAIAGERRHPEGGEAAVDQVAYLGRLDEGELAQWYGEASIYCLPARYEPFGLSVLEAALAGCALVLGDIPSLRENWNDAAVFVNPNDESALERALMELIADPHRRVSLRARARARAQQFTPERMAAAYVAAYDAVGLKQEEALCA